MIIILFFYLIASLIYGAAAPEDGVYDLFAGPNLHVIMCDNGTPGDFDDDFVIDWEDNRCVFNFVLDR